jgi:hypothetical protein
VRKKKAAPEKIQENASAKSHDMEVDAIGDGSIEKFSETYWEVAVRIAKCKREKRACEYYSGCS